MRRGVVVLAGSDPLGYSGLQADLRHLAHLGIPAAGIPTALTLQSVDRVHAIHPVPAAEVTAALQLALEDLQPGAVKIGMLSGAEQVHACAAVLRAARTPVVLDPVIAATAGTVFLDAAALAALHRELLPVVTLLTPNLPELQQLAAQELHDEAAVISAARSLHLPAVLVKGGHADGAEVRDLLVMPERVMPFVHERQAGRIPRGTGCMLATLCAAEMAQGSAPEAAVSAALPRVDAAIRSACAEGRLRLEP